MVAAGVVPACGASDRGEGVVVLARVLLAATHRRVVGAARVTLARAGFYLLIRRLQESRKACEDESAQPSTQSHVVHGSSTQTGASPCRCASCAMISPATFLLLPWMSADASLRIRRSTSLTKQRNSADELLRPVSGSTVQSRVALIGTAT